MESVLDRLFSYFFTTGSQGVIIVMLLCCIIVMARVCVVLFRMYEESIEKRLEDSLAFHESIKLLTVAIDVGLKSLSSTRRR